MTGIRPFETIAGRLAYSTCIPRRDAGRERRVQREQHQISNRCFHFRSPSFARRQLQLEIAGPGDNGLSANKSIQHDRTAQFVSKLNREAVKKAEDDSARVTTPSRPATRSRWGGAVPHAHRASPAATGRSRRDSWAARFRIQREPPSTLSGLLISPAQTVEIAPKHEVAALQPAARGQEPRDQSRRQR
jgi:hypothetical protein